LDFARLFPGVNPQSRARDIMDQIQTIYPDLGGW
jgi:hypothetical protein